MAAEAGVDNDLDGRGIALADFDDDGRLDIYQTNANQNSLLYHNVSAPAGHWIELKLIGTKSNRDAIGARATLKAGGGADDPRGQRRQRLRRPEHRRLHFGLGKAAAIESLEIRWPSGKVEKVTVPVDRVTTVKEGAGVVK